VDGDTGSDFEVGTWEEVNVSERCGYGGCVLICVVALDGVHGGSRTRAC
jgi:hypothetical protein